MLMDFKKYFSANDGIIKAMVYEGVVLSVTSV